ncbi:MAG: ISAs1 family transposase [Methylobacter sp.]|nr:ISAs1 family transposase [Methylobacter sp.]MDP3054510.1 ISAs1 family transposase [Methylobacter sp.]MDP3362632.1 ISAs1 family transposase [Methylobacter sp.]MDZ4218244.1 ISAs1 family transposase [Methylobacter sp.]
MAGIFYFGISLIDALKTLPDLRDNRGKRHSQVFLIATFAFATLVGRSTVSGIHRYMNNKIDWLREVTGYKEATPVSRAHLPRMLGNLDWLVLSCVINDCFGEQTVQMIQGEWISADGKVMRGTLKSGEKQAIIHAVSHESRIDVAQARQAGDKSSEITVMREFLKETGLENGKISLDAHHCNPETMAQVEQAGGLYLIQVKENQPKLLEHCRFLAEQSPLAETINHDGCHGFVTTRHAQLHNLQLSAIDNRWQHSGLQTLVVMKRETFNQSSQKTSNETSYYLSNHANDRKQHTVNTLAHAIRGHWSVESNNWQLDVTFGEDRVQVGHDNQAQIMGKLRCFAMNLIRWSKTGTQNFQATIEKFTDSPEDLVSMLEQVNFL